MEQHERERLETARPEDESQRSPSPVIAEPPDSSHGVFASSLVELFGFYTALGCIL